MLRLHKSKMLDLFNMVMTTFRYLEDIITLDYKFRLKTHFDIYPTQQL